MDWKDATQEVAEAGVDIPDDAVAVVIHESLERGRKVDVLSAGEMVEYRNDEPTTTKVAVLNDGDVEDDRRA